MSTPTPDSRGAALKRSNDSMGDIRTLPSLGLSPYPSGGEATTTATVAAASNAAFRARLDAPSNLEETPSSLGNNDRKPSLSRLNSNASGASGRSSLDIPSGSARPVKRGKRDSWNNNHNVDGVNVEDFDDVDLAGISRKFPQEKRLELAARIDARAEDVAGAWAALLLAQTGMRYAEWATTQSRVEQTKQNTLRIVKAIVNYLVTASQAKLRQTISYIVAKRRRQARVQRAVSL